MADIELGIDGLTDAEPVGAGGNAVVYRAHEEDQGRLVAVKVIRGLGDDAERRRFDRERKAMGRLSQHEGIVTIHYSGTTSRGEPFIVMPFLENGSLQDRLDSDGPFSVADAMAVMTTICETVAFAHERGVIHRDLKPGNVMFSQTGFPLVTDFGISRSLDASASMQSTAITLTPAYSPPEVINGAAATKAADVYALGAMLFALVVGTPPFTSGDDESLFAVLLRVSRDAVRDLRPEGVPEHVCAAIECAMAKDPAERPVGAMEFAAMLRAENVDPDPAPPADQESPTDLGPPGDPSAAPDPGAGPVLGATPDAAVVESVDLGAREEVTPAYDPSMVEAIGIAEMADVTTSTPVLDSRSSTFGIPPTTGGPPRDIGEPSGRARNRVLVGALVAVMIGVAAFAIRSASGGDDTSDDVQRGPDETRAATTTPGGTDAPVTVSSAADEPAASTAPAVVVPPGAGGTLSITSATLPETLNPYLSFENVARTAASLVLEPLAEYEPDGRIVPVLAAEIPTFDNGGVSSDLQSITWRLREGVVWSDGSPFTAEDVVITWQYCAADPDRCVSQSFNDVTEVRALDPATVVVSFDGPTSFPFRAFTSFASPILQAAQFAGCLETTSAGCESADMRPVGTGPFVVADFAPADGRAAFRHNDQYRGNPDGLPFFGEVGWTVEPDDDTAARAVLTLGEADYVPGLGTDVDTLEALQAAGVGRVVMGFGSIVEQLNLNQTNPNSSPPSDYANGSNPNPFFFENPVLTVALSLAIDREALAAAYDSTVEVACNVWEVRVERSPNNDGCLGPDVTEANRILEDELGYRDTDGDGVRELPDGTPLSWELATSTNSSRQNVQELLRQQWSEIGVELRIVDHPTSELFFVGSGVSLWRFATDILMFANGPVEPDAREYFASFTTPQIPETSNDLSGSNIVRLASRRFDDLHDELTHTAFGDPRRTDIIVEMNDIIVRDAGAIIPLLNRGSTSAHAVSVEGVAPNGWDSDLWNVEHWFRR